MRIVAAEFGAGFMAVKSTRTTTMEMMTHNVLMCAPTVLSAEKLPMVWARRVSTVSYVTYVWSALRRLVTHAERELVANAVCGGVHNEYLVWLAQMRISAGGVP